MVSLFLFFNLIINFFLFNLINLVKISDPSNNICNVSGLKIDFKDINSKPPETTTMKKLFNEAILREYDQIADKSISFNNVNYSVNSKFNK